MAIMAIDTMAIAPTMPMSVILQATLLNPAMALLLPAMALLLPAMTLLLPVMALLLLAMMLPPLVMTLLQLVMTLLLLVMTHPLLVRISTDKYYCAEYWPGFTVVCKKVHKIGLYGLKRP